MLADFGILTLFFFWSINIPDSSEHTIGFHSMVGLQIMNGHKDGRTIKTTCSRRIFWCYLSYFWVFLPLCKWSNLYFHGKAFFKKLTDHAFSMKQNGLLKNAEGNSFNLFHEHTDWWQRKNYIQKNSPDKLNETGNHLYGSKLQGLPSNWYLVQRSSWLLSLLLNLAKILS